MVVVYAGKVLVREVGVEVRWWWWVGGQASLSLFIVCCGVGGGGGSGGHSSVAMETSATVWMKC